jgi:hypothetical protein
MMIIIQEIMTMIMAHEKAHPYVMFRISISIDKSLCAFSVAYTFQPALPLNLTYTLLIHLLLFTLNK